MLLSFSALGLCDELVKTVTSLGYITPTPIQIETIPMVLSERDMLAVAQTGTGKTASFTLPMLQLLKRSAPARANSVRALVITPTRELAAQVALSVQMYSRDMNFRSAAVFGGVRIEPQISLLQEGLDVLVATPGRLIDLYNQQAISFEQLDILVFDEADRMLDMGFVDDIRRIQKLLPINRQTLMFSATFSNAIKLLAEGMLNNPITIELASATRAIDTIKQNLYHVDKCRKNEVLIHLIKKNKWRQVLVFNRTKHGADSLVLKLKNAGIAADSIHANRTQHARTRTLSNFKSGDVVVLVATDIASRGIDVSQLPCVINFDLPYLAEDYVHRVGRTGRAGALGLAISLYSDDESKQLQSIERYIGRKFTREMISGFAPKKKTLIDTSDDDVYGNFEPDPKPQRTRKKSRTRKP